MTATTMSKVHKNTPKYYTTKQNNSNKIILKLIFYLEDKSVRRKTENQQCKYISIIALLKCAADAMQSTKVQILGTI